MDWMSSNITFPKIKLSMPGTFYVPMPRRPPGIDCKAPDITHRETIDKTQIWKNSYVHISIKFDAVLEDHLVRAFSGLVLIDYSLKFVIKFLSFDDVKIMLSRLEQM